jgi:hypothetical protein
VLTQAGSIRVLDVGSDRMGQGRDQAQVIVRLSAEAHSRCKLGSSPSQ